MFTHPIFSLPKGWVQNKNNNEGIYTYVRYENIPCIASVSWFLAQK